MSQSALYMVFFTCVSRGKSMDICIQMKNLFSLLEELYVFMSDLKNHDLSTNLDKDPTKKDWIECKLQDGQAEIMQCEQLSPAVTQ